MPKRAPSLGACSGHSDTLLANDGPRTEWSRAGTLLFRHGADESITLSRNAISSRLNSSGRGKLDWFAVRRVAVRIGPGFLALDERGPIEQSLRLHEALERGQPMIVIMRSSVRLTALRGRLDSLASAAAHSFHVK